jgi:phage-related protein (TIGR01555 family)
VNFAQKLGMSADNPMATSSYSFNPLSRNRVMLEWIYRGSWIAGKAVDAVADDMTRAGIEYTSEVQPQDAERIDRVMLALNTWPVINETIKWGRLYGGAIGVVLIDGQDFRTPLRTDTVGLGQYKGMMTFDRWMVEPSLEDLVTELGPHLGLPKYYRITQAAPALRGIAVHHSRVAIRHCGVALPYQQRMIENMWGLSVIERLYDRLVAFDSASTGAAQLVYKAYLRTLSIDGLRDLVAAGGPALIGLTTYVGMMARYQGQEGITMIDAKDKFEAQSGASFSGLDSALSQFSQQLSGALGIPLVRLFGQSPGGLGSSGESEMRTYYDGVNQEQITTLLHGVTMLYKLGARSTGVILPPNFSIDFRSLWELSDGDKHNIAKTSLETVTGATDAGLISHKTALQELRQSSRITGVFTNITADMIAAADDTIAPPAGAEDPMGGMLGAPPAEMPGVEASGASAAEQLPTNKGPEEGLPGSAPAQPPAQLPQRRPVTNA